jgi:hypothetical protein
LTLRLKTIRREDACEEDYSTPTPKRFKRNVQFTKLFKHRSYSIHSPVLSIRTPPDSDEEDNGSISRIS